MRPFLTAVWSVRGIAELLGALLLAVAIWFVAPALAGIDAIWLLCLLAALPVLFWLALMVFVVRRGLRRDAALVAGATALDPALEKEKAVNAAAEAEEREVSQRLEQALSKLQAAGASKWGSLYERPWYVIIGPPGAGKTTAIRNSGLDFLIEGGKVSGVGGTRNCDWWISEQAVLIDTAGRYTTQDSDKDADRTSWERFLDLLRRERPRQPLNGIIVAFAADMLSTLDADGCLEHARKVRSRIREMEDKLEQRLPVYFLICKADTVLGFTEFFDGISREARGQVWGVTFSPETKTEERTGELKAGYVKLIERLQSQLVDRLQSEPGASKRALLAGFPVQFATLEEPLLNFAKAAFGGSSVDPAPYLRGLYFASGTQEGSPIDRLTGVLAREFGLQPDQPEAFKGQGRSYFLSRLLREVVFNEARLASRQPKAEQRKRLAVACTWAASAALLVGGLWLGWRTLDAEAARMQQATAASQALETAASGLPLARSTAIDDLARFLPYLNKAAAVAEVGKGSSWSLGLSQEEKLHEAGQLAYQRALERVMLPRLIARLESQLQAGMNDPDYTYLGV